MTLLRVMAGLALMTTERRPHPYSIGIGPGPFAFPYPSALVSTPGPIASVDSGLDSGGA